MATFFEAIIARFRAKLTPSPFVDLYQTAPPLDCREPYAVLDTGNEPHTSYCFGAEFHEEDFTISVVDKTQEVAESLARQILDAFDDCEPELTVDGMNVSLLRKDRVSNRFVESGFWITEIKFKTEYSTRR
jgi:hypothetical protein